MQLGISIIRLNTLLRLSFYTLLRLLNTSFGPCKKICISQNDSKQSIEQTVLKLLDQGCRIQFMYCATENPVTYGTMHIYKYIIAFFMNIMTTKTTQHRDKTHTNQEYTKSTVDLSCGNLRKTGTCSKENFYICNHIL